MPPREDALQVFTTIAALRAARPAFPQLGLVPTMGFLHAGHISLIERAKAECSATAVSIFVNPTQFAPTEDLDRYPRDHPADLRKLREAGVDIVFLPEAAEIYPPGFATSISPGPIAARLEGAARPGHFNGVATVVAKLFNIIQPTSAYFGQKDAQQCAVIQQLVADLNLPVRIVIGPTIREADGLALSSRNVYLTPNERAQAPKIHQALQAAQAALAAGEHNATTLRTLIQNTLSTAPDLRPDYISIAHPTTLEELNHIESEALALIAAHLGTTRLIDNLKLHRPPPP